MKSVGVTALTAAAIGTIGLGLLVGFAMPVHAEGVSCGTALRASNDADVADYLDTLAGNLPRAGVIGGVEAACDEARNTPRLVTFVIIGLGVVAGITAYVAALAGSSAKRVDETVPAAVEPAPGPPALGGTAYWRDPKTIGPALVMALIVIGVLVFA